MPIWQNQKTGESCELSYDDAHKQRNRGVDLILLNGEIRREVPNEPTPDPAPFKGMKAKLNREQNKPGAASHTIV